MMRYAGSLLTMTLVTAGSIACATPAAGQALRQQGGGYDVTVLVDGVPAPTYQHAGESYVLGQMGERYVLRVSNHTGRRIEAVVSVDGRDVIDGRPADFRNKRGYLVPAWGSVDIEGWRLSARQAAVFRFSSVADSYAARTGNAREVGVIGVAVFPERFYTPPPRPYQPYEPYYPYDDATPYRNRGYGDKKAEAPSADSGRGSESAGAPAPAAPPVASAEEAPLSRRAPSQRPGLGTEYGEATHSPIREVSFVRANPGRPSMLLGLRYNDRSGLMAVGIDLDNAWGPDDTYLRQTAHPFPVSNRGYSTPPPGWRRQW
jgi:hypothetical protein